jgi:hypothetical protein
MMSFSTKYCVTSSKSHVFIDWFTDLTDSLTTTKKKRATNKYEITDLFVLLKFQFGLSVLARF